MNSLTFIFNIQQVIFHTSEINCDSRFNIILFDKSCNFHTWLINNLIVSFANVSSFWNRYEQKINLFVKWKSSSSSSPISLRNQNAKKELRTKIKKYLHRVNIVEDSKTFSLLRNTIALLDEARTTTTNSFIVNDSTLHSILQSMQTTIEQLQRNDSRFKSKNYTKFLQIVLEFVIKSIVANKSINFKTTKQVREFMILIVDDVERKILKIIIIKNIMNKLNYKKIRRITQLNNDDLKIQTKFEKIKSSLQKKSEIIRWIIESITIHIRIHAMRINEVKIEHIDTNN